MFRTIHTLVLAAGLFGLVGECFAQDPVTERPGKTPSTAVPAAQKQVPVAAKLLTTLEGREEGLIAGPLAFHCYDGGKVVMIDGAKKPVEGSIKVEANRIQFIFGNCIYEGTEPKVGSLAGTARFTKGPNAGKAWTFSVAMRNVLPGRSFTGNETLPGYGAVTFRFVNGATVEMIDKHGVTSGTYTQNGFQVAMTFGSVVYTGDIRGDNIAGSARDPKSNWTFNVNASK